MYRKKLNIQNKLTIIDQLSIAKYLQELNTDKDTRPLTPEMEKALFTEYKLSGNKAIKERLIKANLRWVVTIAKQFTYPKVCLEDLINEGNIGLIKAIDKFDATKGNGFLSFATWDIRQAITTFFGDTFTDMVQPANRYRINRLFKQAEKILIDFGNVTPTVEQLLEVYFEIKESTDPVLSAADYNEIITQTKGFVSMELQLAGSDNEDLILGNTFKSDVEYSADHTLVKEDANYEMRKMLHNSLNEREREIVEYSFGLNVREEKTLEQISEIVGITRERVGQLLQGALLKLKNHKHKVYELCGNAKGTIQCEESTWNKG